MALTLQDDSERWWCAALTDTSQRIIIDVNVVIKREGCSSWQYEPWIRWTKCGLKINSYTWFGIWKRYAPVSLRSRSLWPFEIIWKFNPDPLQVFSTCFNPWVQWSALWSSRWLSYFPVPVLVRFLHQGYRIHGPYLVMWIYPSADNLHRFLCPCQ